MNRLAVAIVASAVAVAMAMAIGACAKKQEAPAADETKTGAQIEVPEIKRGEDACAAWQTRVCRCAETAEEFKPACGEAGKIPDAMKLAIQAANSEGLEKETSARLLFEARRIMARCLQEQGKLDPARCPASPASP